LPDDIEAIAVLKRKPSHDVETVVRGGTLKVQVKGRAKGYATIHFQLNRADVLIIKADRKPALVILPLSPAAELVSAARAHVSEALPVSPFQHPGWGGANVGFLPFGGHTKRNCAKLCAPKWLLDNKRDQMPSSINGP
jgi:hypothetical protein